MRYVTSLISRTKHCTTSIEGYLDTRKGHTRHITNHTHTHSLTSLILAKTTSKHSIAIAAIILLPKDDNHRNA